MDESADLGGHDAASLSDLTRFVEWGGPTWGAQVARGLEWLGDVNGLRILEIGTRYGGMATLLALRGAVVTALDITSDAFEVARETSERHGVGDRVRYEVYSGEPRDLPTGFDVVFSKSTLVLMPDLEVATRGIAASLVGGGRLLAVENTRGPLVVHVARMIRRRSLRPHGANYFTRRSIDAIGLHLRIDLQHWTATPPTVVVGAVKD